MSDDPISEEVRRTSREAAKALHDKELRRAAGNAADAIAAAQALAPTIARAAEFQRLLHENSPVIMRAAEATLAARERVYATFRDNPEFVRMVANMARIQAQIAEAQQTAADGGPATGSDDEPDVDPGQLAQSLVEDDEFRAAAAETITDAPERLGDVIPPDELREIYGADVDLRFVYPVLAIVGATEAFLQLAENPAVRALVGDAEWIVNFAWTIYLLLNRYVDPKLRGDESDGADAVSREDG